MCIVYIPVVVSPQTSGSLMYNPTLDTNFNVHWLKRLKSDILVSVFIPFHFDLKQFLRSQFLVEV